MNCIWLSDNPSIIMRGVTLAPSRESSGWLWRVSQQWFLRFVAHWRDEQDTMMHSQPEMCEKDRTNNKNQQTHSAGVLPTVCVLVLQWPSISGHLDLHLCHEASATAVEESHNVVSCSTAQSKDCLRKSFYKIMPISRSTYCFFFYRAYNICEGVST